MKIQFVIHMTATLSYLKGSENGIFINLMYFTTCIFVYILAFCKFFFFFFFQFDDAVKEILV